MKGISAFFRDINKNKALLIMALPATIWFICFSYLPMAGMVIAFKEYRYSRDGFLASILNSEWVGFDNFKFLFSTSDAYIITRNTILYNAVFIVLGLIMAVALAIILSELVNKRLAKFFQTAMFLPHFLSWVIVAYFVYSFLSYDKGIVNQLLGWLGVDLIQWYNDKTYWTVILVLVFLWKSVGYNSVI